MSFPDHPNDGGNEFHGECEECGDDVPNEDDEMCGPCQRDWEDYQNEQLQRAAARFRRRG